MAKIYTKVGDKGGTGLVGGQKVGKDDPRIEAYGTVDELNSAIGWARLAVEQVAKTVAGGSASSTVVDEFARLSADFETLQHWLFDLGSLLASEKPDREKFKLSQMTAGQVKWVEERIDGATKDLAPLRQFILPGGAECAARIHLVRTVCRRAERCIVRAGMGADLPDNAVPFVNRLSDYFFTMARWCNARLGVADVAWKKS